MFSRRGFIRLGAALFSNKELAVVANVGSLVQPTTRAQYQARSTAVPVNLFSHADQQAQWQTSVPNGVSGTGWRDARQIW